MGLIWLRWSVWSWIGRWDIVGALLTSDEAFERKLRLHDEQTRRWVLLSAIMFPTRSLFLNEMIDLKER